MECFFVDTFTDTPLTGNPTVVCIDSIGQLNDELMQKIAIETNQTNTVFLSIPNLTNGQTNDHITIATTDVFNIRWFSPSCEVRLCGHGTLAAAIVLSQVYNNQYKTIHYNSLSGRLKTVINNNNIVDLSLPMRPCRPISNHKELFQSLVRLTIGNTPILHYQYSETALNLLIRLDDNVTRTELEGLKPDIRAMIGINQNKVISIAVTVKANQLIKEGCGYDFFSRYFCPWVGNAEDYVTGAAHTVLGPYWSEQLNNTAMKARQCSSRGGDLGVAIDNENGCVILTGGGKIVIKGIMNI